MRDRETFAGISRYWYTKASYHNPHIGRLYHHLAILSRPFSLQQLSNYCKALTCVSPFVSALNSILTLFNPILSGKESTSLRLNDFDIRIIKAQAIQVLNLSKEEFWTIVEEIRNGSLSDHVNRITSRFKEQGVFLANALNAAILEHGVPRQGGAPGGLIWLGFCNDIIGGEALQSTKPTSTESSTSTTSSDPALRFLPRPKVSVDEIPVKQLEESYTTIHESASIWSVCLSTALQSPRNPNFYPFLHIIFVFLWSLTRFEKGISYVEAYVPWEDLCFFLNTLKTGALAATVLQEGFPQPSEGVGRPLPEDYMLRGQVYSWWYFPKTWFLDARVDEEERSLEFPSMVEARLRRLFWLAGRIAVVSPRVKPLFLQALHPFAKWVTALVLSLLPFGHS